MRRTQWTRVARSQLYNINNKSAIRGNPSEKSLQLKYYIFALFSVSVCSRLRLSVPYPFSISLSRRVFQSIHRYRNDGFRARVYPNHNNHYNVHYTRVQLPQRGAI